MPTMTNTTGHPQSTPEDQSWRFLFEQADIRGETAHLDAAYREILAIHQYGVGVSRLLGEFLAAAVLLSTNLKFEGKLILQVRSDGQVPLLMAECNHNLQVRGIARGAQQAISNNNEELLHNGQLAITIDPTNGQRYQGIVPLRQGSLASSLDAYFEQSEQLKTRIWLAANGRQAGGLLLQELPPKITSDQTRRLHQWEHACSLAATVRETEVLELSGERLLNRLYWNDQVRLFEPRPISFRCTCSRERTHSVLATLDRSELLEILDELGHVTMECEFCNQSYQFTRGDLTDILKAEVSKTLH